MNVSVSVFLGMVWGFTGVISSLVNSTDPINVPLQYGALGILGYMVWANSRERQSMVSSINKKDDEFRKLLVRSIEANEKMTAATEAIVHSVSQCQTAQRRREEEREEKENG